MCIERKFKDSEKQREDCENELEHSKTHLALSEEQCEVYKKQLEHSTHHLEQWQKQFDLSEQQNSRIIAKQQRNVNHKCVIM